MLPSLSSLQRRIAIGVSLLIGITIASSLSYYFLSTDSSATVSSQREPRKLRIVATTGMIGDALKEIAQDKVEIIVLMGPGVNPHSYEPTAQDGSHLMGADLVLYNGLQLEGSMHTTFSKIAQREKEPKKKKFYAISDALAPEDLIEDPQFSISKDPHIWHDPIIWQKVVTYIGEILAEKDPIHADIYLNNTSTYLSKLATLHEEIEAAIAKIPSKKKYFVTAHDAFGYLAKRYGLHAKGLQGFSTAVEPGVGDRENLKQFIIQHDIKAVFTETSVNNKGIEAVIESCQKEGHQVLTSDELYSDSLGEKKGSAENYIGMMRHNIKIIVEALTKK